MSRCFAFVSMLVLLSLTACHRRVDLSEQAVDAVPVGAGLPAHFLLAAATSAYQTEGGNTQDDWYDWENVTLDGQSVIANGDRAGHACDSWNRWSEDLDELQYIGANAYRFSIEWSRLEPVQGAWDEAAAQHYRTLLVAMRARGIEPILTVYHNTFPRWVAAQGGWEWDGLGDAAASFARRLGATYGDLVDTYITVNEPNAIVVANYVVGSFPPGVRDADRAFEVYANTLHVHAMITRALRETDTVDADHDGRATFIGLAHNITVFEPASTSATDTTMAAFADDVFNESVPRAIKTGRMSVWLPSAHRVDRAMPELVGTFDYLGINYYRRFLIRGDLLRGVALNYAHTTGAMLTDSSDEVYPEGLYLTLKRFAGYGWPIIVTEHGIADRYDAHRAYSLRSHVRAIELAIEDGVDVRGYVHWTLMDNFEWAAGYEAKMGLFSVDFGDPALPRTPRASARTFADIAHNMRSSPAWAEP